MQEAPLMASIIFVYPVQRHKFPPSASRISCVDGSGFSSSRAFADMITPGPQNPHCREPKCSNNFCSGCRCSAVASPSMVSTSRPSTWPASIRQEFTGLPSTITVHAPQSPTSHPSFAPVRLNWSRNSRSSVVSGGTEALRVSPFSLSVTFTIGSLQSLRLGQRPCAFERSFRKHGDQVPAVLCGSAKIADGFCIAYGHAARLRHRFRSDRAALEVSLGLRGANHLRRDGSERDSRCEERVLLPIDPEARPHVDKRQRLSLAQSELQEVRWLAYVLFGNDDLGEKFIRLKNRFPRTHKKLAQWQLTPPAITRDGDDRLERHQRRTAVHRRHRRHQVSPQRAKISRLHRADRMCRVHQSRK